MKLRYRYKKLSTWNKIYFWGSLASITALLIFFLEIGFGLFTYIYSAVFESNEIELFAYDNFFYIYHTNYDDALVIGPELEGWPENLGEWGNFIVFGLHPHAALRIRNNLKTPISVSYIKGYLKVGNWNGHIQTWQRYDNTSFDGKESFPLYLREQEEKVIVVPFEWPVSEEFHSKIPRLTRDSLYTAPFLTKAYMSSFGEGIMGPPEAFALRLKEYMIKNLREIIAQDSLSPIELNLRVVLSNNDFYETVLNITDPIK